MNNVNRRRHPRYETVVDVEIHTTDLKFTGIMRDISVSGIGVISKKRNSTGHRGFYHPQAHKPVYP